MNGLMFLSVLSSWTANAKAVALPVAKVENTELITVLANEKYLLLLLLANAGYIIWGLVRSIWDSKAKKLDEIQKLAALLPSLIHKIETMDEHLKKNVPTHDSVEVKIWRAMKGRDQ